MEACRATRLNLALCLLIAGICACRAKLALGASRDMLKPETLDLYRDAETNMRIAGELKPFFALASVRPGTYGFGGEVEFLLHKHLSLFADLIYSRSRMSDSIVAEIRADEGKDEGVAREVRAINLDGGARYYGNAFADSWYLGGKLGIGKSKVDWVYGDEELTDDAVVYRSEVDVGYRWLWTSGFSVRLGMGMGATTPTKRKITRVGFQPGIATDAARKDIERQAPSTRAFTGSFDVGLGYVF